MPRTSPLARLLIALIARMWDCPHTDMVSLLADAMNPDGQCCPECAKHIEHRCKLYRHRIDNHQHRYCLFCDQWERRPSRLKCHVRRKQATVDAESLPTPVFRAGDEPIRPVLPQRPTPKPYSCEQNLSCDYVPTPKKRCLTKSLTEDSMEWETVEDFVIEEPPMEATAVRRTPSGRGRGFGKSRLPSFCWAGDHAVSCGVVATAIHQEVSNQVGYHLGARYCNGAGCSWPNESGRLQCWDNLLSGCGISQLGLSC